MRPALRSLPLVVTFLLVAAPRADADVELRNDTFVDGSQAAAQGGFVPGEVAASRYFVATPAQLLRVKVIFANETAGGTPRDVTLHVWADTQTGLNPGAELFSGEFTLTPSTTAISDLNLTAENITVSGYFRIGIEVHHTGPPSVTNDTDGYTNVNNSLIRESTLGWRTSSFFGVSGDWILRATVSDGAGPPIDAGVDAPPGTIDAAPGGPDAGQSGECQGNGDCAIGSYCDTNTNACTFDCRNDGDCGADECNTLGQCVAADGDAGGCCSTGTGGGVAGSLALGGAVALLLSRRRRRR